MAFLLKSVAMSDRSCSLCCSSCARRCTCAFYPCGLCCFAEGCCACLLPYCIVCQRSLPSAMPQALEAADTVGEAMERLSAAIAEERFEGGCAPGAAPARRIVVPVRRSCMVNSQAMAAAAAVRSALLRPAPNAAALHSLLTDLHCRCFVPCRRRPPARPGRRVSGGLVGGPRLGGPLRPPAARHLRFQPLCGPGVHPA